MTTAPPAAHDPDRIVVVGASYRDGSTDAREAALARLPGLLAAFDEHLVLRTCHRVELIGVAGTAAVGDIPPPLRMRQGRAAVERVLTVVAGLDSAIMAEEQLIGQVRDAYRQALADGGSGPILNELMRRALHVGRRARSMAGPTLDRSLADRALAAAGRPASALVVGSGAMAERLATGLAGGGARLAVASRTPERATALAARFGGEGLQWHPSILDRGWELVAFATRIAEPILIPERAASLRAATVIDLCAPSAVAAGARHMLGERLVDLDALGAAAPASPSPRTQRRLESLVAEETDHYLEWLAALPAFDAVARLHARAMELRARHVERLRRSDRFDEAQLAAVERMTSQLVGELLHEPTLRLRSGHGA